MDNKRLYYIIILVILCFFAYCNIFNNSFISDDIPAIVKNPLISSAYHSWLNPTYVLNSFGYLIGGYNPFVYHLTSILLHALNTALVFLFLSLFFKPEASFLASCLFAVHPIHTEAVTWISGKPYIITSLFILIPYLLYFSATKGAKIKLTLYFASLLAFSYYIISSFSWYFVFPFFLIFSDITLNRWKKNYKFWIPFLAILVLRLILARDLISERIYFIANTSAAGINWKNPLMNIVVSLFSHLWLLIWPAKLTLFHGSIKFGPAVIKVGMVFMCIFVCFLLFLFRRAKELAFAIGIFVLCLVPTYSPLRVANIVAERYIYFPSIALSICFAFLYDKYLNKLKLSGRIIVFVILVLVMVAYSFRTITRNTDYKTPERFWDKTVLVSPDSPTAYNEQGLMYYQKGDTQKATISFMKAIDADSTYAYAYNNLGIIYKDLGRPEEAIGLYRKALELDPRRMEVYKNLSDAYSLTGKYKETIESYKEAIKASPEYIDSYINLGVIYRELGRFEEAIGVYKKALEINPNDVRVYYNLANIYHWIGKNAESIMLYKKAIELNEGFCPAYNNLGSLYSFMGQTKEAIILYKKALEINPNSAEACNNLGFAYNKLGRHREAIELYKKAIELDPNYGQAHLNLSAIYFYLKQYNLAIQHCDKAIALKFNVPSDFLRVLKPYRRN
ncbi:MAG: tetratricopeptide repeat protein [Candidatus Omnitrophica bacterium]|nr:tetratricopeptide repeat protein [Candidatus Omnitrophota bacterium]